MLCTAETHLCCSVRTPGTAEVVSEEGGMFFSRGEESPSSEAASRPEATTRRSALPHRDRRRTESIVTFSEHTTAVSDAKAHPPANVQIGGGIVECGVVCVGCLTLLEQPIRESFSTTPLPTATAAAAAVAAVQAVRAANLRVVTQLPRVFAQWKTLF